jgi:hypothetical protein
MKKYIQVEGHPNLVRDINSGAIINTNSKEIAQARRTKKAWKAQQEEMLQLRQDVTIMKEALAKLLEDKNGSNNN